VITACNARFGRRAARVLTPILVALFAAATRRLFMTAQPSDLLDHVNPNWDEAYSALIAYALPVIRVTKSSPEGAVNIVWRNPPSDENKAFAVELIGPATHSC